jgi:hypothetical protein
MPLNPVYYNYDPAKSAASPLIKAEISFDASAEEVFQVLNTIHSTKKSTQTHKRTL